MGTDVEKAGTGSQQVAVPNPDAKPLNATQLKTLERLVASDFEDLREQVKVEIDNRLSRRRDTIQARKAQIEAQFGDDDALDDAIAGITEMVRDFQDQVTARLTALKAKGIIPASDRNGGPSTIIAIEDKGYRLVQTGREEAIAKVDEELQKVNTAAARLSSTAYRVIGRNERAALRQVLLQGVTTVGAAELVNDLPSADDIMVELQAELAKQSEDLDLLDPEGDDA